MAAFDIRETPLHGAFVIEAFHAADNRGNFIKYFEKDVFAAAGINFRLSETFISTSAKNVIRGMHFQLSSPQAKLVSVPKGRICDVIVDIRKDSPCYGKWTSVELSEENCLSLYVPRGFAHGFLSLEDGSTVIYQCDGKYDKATDTGIRFDDPDIAIDWKTGGPGDVICSERDRGLMTFREYDALQL